MPREAIQRSGAALEPRAQNSAFPTDPEDARLLGRIGIARCFTSLLRIAQTGGDPVLPARQNVAQGIAEARRQRLDILAEISNDTSAPEVMACHPGFCILHEGGKPLQRSTFVRKKMAIQLAVEIGAIG